MILLTRLNKHPLVVNSDLIKLIEAAPDTVITLINGEKIVVLESSADILQRVIEFRRRILEGLAPSVTGAAARVTVSSCSAEQTSEEG
jgi:flagellar protein FlbD